MNKLLEILIVILISGYVPIAQAADWSSCADDLDRLRRAARDASDVAQQVDSAKEELESKKDKLENCLNFPDIYDLMDDGCQSIRWEYKSALSDYESELNNLESELNTIGSRLRSIQWSCGFQFSLTATTGVPKDPGQNLCNLYQSYKGRLPIATLIEICKKSMTEEECKKCLDIK